MSSFPEMTDLETPASAEPEAPATTKLDLYREHLASEGFRPEVDEDGDLSFRHEGKSLCIFVHEHDRSFFRLALPAFVECEGAEEEARALRVANRMNKAFKVGKLVIADGTAWANVELFLDDPAALRPVLDRCLDLVGSMAFDFRRLMREESRGRE